MNQEKGRSFTVIIISVALAAVFFRFAIDKFLKINTAQNESAAAANLKMISAALENYAKDKEGVFPQSLSLLAESDPAYLETDYTASLAIKGYTYECPRLEPAGYSCTATPLKCNLSGRLAYTVNTAGVFISEECAKKD